MLGATSSLVDTLVSGAILCVLGALAWFFRQWAFGLSDDIGALRRDVTGQVSELSDQLAEVDGKADEALQRISRLEGAAGLTGWPPTLPRVPPRRARAMIRPDWHPRGLRDDESPGSGGRGEPDR